jgi:YegS/Rv2252/BmrU family lipid kinase
LSENFHTQQIEKSKMLFIINPRSGEKAPTELNERIGGIIDYTRFDVEGVLTEYSGHAHELAQQAVKDNYHYVIAVGGDGTVNEVASALVNTKTVLGIIPTGSGNGLARHLKIPGDIDSAIETINNRTEKFIDSVDINGKYFFNVAGVGFDAYIAEQFGKDGMRGYKAYRKLIFKNYFGYTPNSYEVFTPDANLSVNALMISFANGKQWGNGAIISPKSSVSDGVLDICVVSKVPILMLPSFIRKLMNGKIETSKYVKQLKAKTAVIIQKESRVHFDGEPLDFAQRLEITVHPSSLSVLVKK